MNDYSSSQADSNLCNANLRMVSSDEGADPNLIAEISDNTSTSMPNLTPSCHTSFDEGSSRSVSSVPDNLITLQRNVYDNSAKGPFEVHFEKFDDRRFTQNIITQ
ncbi:hypothetical protein EAI_09664 [Harpegnathos saltator]|uniref:Uncharacterized protein n=1 Tax=Harpegnathos saltator TaxID=610380 RepID=E2BCV3_HARSA|nr:hypothetical protein EAI_09664 [Harpegnathos saltator]